MRVNGSLLPPQPASTTDTRNRARTKRLFMAQSVHGERPESTVASGLRAAILPPVIGRLTGQIGERGIDGSIVLDVNGVGYELFVPLGTLGRLPMNERITLHVHTHVREDALVLYGFATSEDRAAFRTLL